MSSYHVVIWQLAEFASELRPKCAYSLQLTEAHSAMTHPEIFRGLPTPINSLIIDKDKEQPRFHARNTQLQYAYSIPTRWLH